MYLRRILFSFVLLSGVIFLVLPFSVFATTSVVCVRTASATDLACPPGTTYSSAPSSCILNVLFAGKYEHTCLASVDPCSTAVGQCWTATSCTSGFVATNCVGPNNCQSPTPIFCVDSAKFAAATNAAGGPPVCPPGDLTCTTNSSNPVNVTTTVKNPLSFSTVEGVLGSLLGALQGIIVVLSLVFILVGAFFYITSAGDDGRMKTAKGAITASMIGLALGLAAPSFLKQIGTILGWGPVNGAAVASAKTLSDIVLSALQFLLSIVGVLGIIMLVVGGIVYITASGDEDRIDTGKKIVKYAIIGIAIALASLVAVTQIAALFVP